MKNSYEATDIIRNALYLRNASEVLDDLDEEVHEALQSILEEEIEEMEDWTCDGDSFGPDDWYDADEESWLVSFELSCLGNCREDNWLLAAARQQDLRLALVLTVSEDLPRPRQLRMQMEEALEEQEAKIPGLEKRYSPDDEHSLEIPLAGISLEDLAQSSSDWEDILRAPLQEALASAVQLQEALSDLIESRIS